MNDTDDNGGFWGCAIFVWILPFILCRLVFVALGLAKW